MIEVGKYYKSKDSELIVKALSPENEGTFYGEAIVKVEGYDDNLWCDVVYFEPCEAPQTTQPEQSPTKDVELRLECLKLAVNVSNGVRHETEIVAMAEYYYDWITQKQTKPNID